MKSKIHNMRFIAFVLIIDYINIPLQTNNFSTNAISARIYGDEK